jgi:hypothetical protein
MREQIARGGILLWVKVRDSDQEKRAHGILARHAATDVHAHDVSA